MPGFDGTGPDFEGPMTGGARGYCAGERPFAGTGCGFGYGYGRGRSCRPGFGRRGGVSMDRSRWRDRSVVASGSMPNGPTGLDELQRQAALMQRQLDRLNQKIGSLQAGPGDADPPVAEQDV